MTMLEKLRRKQPEASAEQQTGPGSPGYTEVHARRDELAAVVAELTWDLGGLTYEMAIRDHFRIDVLVRRASELQTVAAELGEVERLLAAEYEGISGGCRSCGAPHSRGAVFCWQCGQQILTEAPSAAVTGVTGPTADPGDPGTTLEIPPQQMPPQGPPAPRSNGGSS